MAATLYSDILKEAERTGFRYGDFELRDWMRDKASQVTSARSDRLVGTKRAQKRAVSKPEIGKMYFYNYDPKHKLTLPYYDTFPLIFCIEHYDDGFLGINLHYLPPMYRARLMDFLYETISNEKYDDTTKLNINYRILNNASRLSYFRPCIKRYLSGHLRSSLIEIDPKEWDYVLMLPLARFKKRQQRNVWNESVNQINRKRR